jgi:hypothetical protein
MDWTAWSDQVAEMVRWANKYAGQKYWLKKDEWSGSTFYFTEGKDATMFILKWSS